MFWMEQENMCHMRRGVTSYVSRKRGPTGPPSRPPPPVCVQPYSFTNYSKYLINYGASGPYPGRLDKKSYDPIFFVFDMSHNKKSSRSFFPPFKTTEHLTIKVKHYFHCLNILKKLLIKSFNQH